MNKKIVIVMLLLSLDSCLYPMQSTGSVGGPGAQGIRRAWSLPANLGIIEEEEFSDDLCGPVNAGKLEETIRKTFNNLTKFKKGLQGFVKSVPRTISDPVKGIYRQFDCYLKEILQWQEEFSLQKRSLPKCYTKNFHLTVDAGNANRQMQEYLKELLDSFSGGEIKTVRTLLNQVENMQNHLIELKVLLEGLHGMSECCQKKLATKTWRQKLRECWPKKSCNDVKPFKNKGSIVEIEAD